MPDHAPMARCFLCDRRSLGWRLCRILHRLPVWRGERRRRCSLSLIPSPVSLSRSGCCSASWWRGERSLPPSSAQAADIDAALAMSSVLRADGRLFWPGDPHLGSPAVSWRVLPHQHPGRISGGRMSLVSPQRGGFCLPMPPRHLNRAVVVHSRPVFSIPHSGTEPSKQLPACDPVESHRFLPFASSMSRKVQPRCRSNPPSLEILAKGQTI
jgi:hypothetical protein